VCAPKCARQEMALEGKTGPYSPDLSSNPAIGKGFKESPLTGADEVGDSDRCRLSATSLRTRILSHMLSANRRGHFAIPQPDYFVGRLLVKRHYVGCMNSAMTLMTMLTHKTGNFPTAVSDASTRPSAPSSSVL